MQGLLAIQRNTRAPWNLPFSPSELERMFLAMLTEYHVDAPPVDGENVFFYKETPQVELLLLEDAAMEVLHKEALHCAGPTNVLSFPSPEEPDGPPWLGSMALSVDTLARECFLYGQDLEEHCVRLLAHGLAHLLGYDHGPQMQALTDRLEVAAAEALPR